MLSDNRCHHLAGGGDVKTGLTGSAVVGTAEPGDDVPQLAVVDVEDPPPGDLMRVEPEAVSLVDVVADHRRQQVVGGGDGVHVAGQVQVECLHRDHLRVAAAGGAALDAEGRPHGRLPDGDDAELVDVPEALAEPDRGGRLARPERSRGDRADHDVLGARPVPELVDRVEGDLRRRVPVGFEQMGADAHVGGNVLERTTDRGAGDREVGWYGGGVVFEMA